MKLEEKIRVIVDVNIWISFLIGRRLQRIFDVLVRPQITLIFSKELLDELCAVTQRPKFKKYFSSSENVEELLNFLSNIGEIVELPEILPEKCRDRKDDYLLELAVISNADFLITGDKDLLVIQTIGECQIVTASEFDAATAALNCPTTLNEALVEYGVGMP
jgi:putative PIN family toxin of toxin-antitoxin system